MVYYLIYSNFLEKCNSWDAMLYVQKPADNIWRVGQKVKWAV